MFGGIELMVPENWKVHVRCFVAFGGIEVHN
jgi:predicted membrane protein